MSDPEVSPCPVGYYCPEATWEPITCPPGTYRDSTGAGNITDCFLCPAGYYCPDTNGTLAGIICDVGKYLQDVL